MKLYKNNLTLLIGAIIAIAFLGCNEKPKPTEKVEVEPLSGTIILSKEALYNKIKGGWAGQTIGVVYGAPVEFKYNGSMIHDDQNIPWNEHYVKYWWDKNQGYLTMCILT
jgi:hypothetical protein